MSFSFRRTKRREDVGVDRLTGAFNRRQLDADIAAGADTSDRSTATLMVEVDAFDRHDGRKGHAKPETVLERVAWVIMATVRTTDVVYRHEESTFCVLLPSTSDSDAAIVAERVRNNVAKMPLLAEHEVTVSVGLAVAPAHDVQTAVERATEALGAERRRKSALVGPGAEAIGESAAAGVDEIAPVVSGPLSQPLVEPDLAPFEDLRRSTRSVDDDPVA